MKGDRERWHGGGGEERRSNLLMIKIPNFVDENL